MNKIKTLLFDIETSPIISYNWGVWEQNAIKVIKDWEVLSISYKWLGEKEISFIGRKNGVYGEKDVLKRIWGLFNEADIVVAHNGDQFDIKKVNTRLAKFGFTPPAPYKQVDTKKVAKNRFGFTFNSLDELSKFLGCPVQKIKHEGFGMWEKCMAGDKKAWQRMKEYNKRDVEVLEWIYLRLRPWMTNHPNSNVFSDTQFSCPACSSNRLQRRGYSVTRISKRQRYQCLSCGAWSSGEVIKINKNIIR